MPVFYTRVNLNSAIFPFYSEASGRTIIVPEYDENWDRNNAANTSPEKGVPQVFYMHNVLPIAAGFQSVGYTAMLPSFGTGNDFDQTFSLSAPDGSRVLFVPSAGDNYVYDAQVGSWARVSSFSAAAVTENTIVTSAYINGQTYFCYAGYGTFYYNDSNQTIIQLALLTLNAATTLGICASNGYMIAWSATSVAWSSLENPLDFTPSIQTGAGGGSIQQAKGNINFCLPISGGFLIYCQFNVVSATYTNNINYPWIFKEIPDSGGCYDPNQAAWGDNLDTHYVMTTKGLQSFNLNQGQAVFPEVTDFLAAQLFEDFDETTQELTYQYLDAQLFTKFAVVEDRFFVFSYGINAGQFTHAIIFDMTLGRYGKLKINHSHCFQYNFPNQYLGSTYGQLLAQNTSYNQLINTTYGQLTSGGSIIIPKQKQSFAFLQSNGAVQVVNFALQEQTADGVFILGKYQFKRSNLLTLQEVEVESINSGNTFNTYALPTLDGKTFLPAVGLNLNNQGAQTYKYNCRLTAKNISLIFQGAFHLTSAQIQFMVAGYR